MLFGVDSDMRLKKKVKSKSTINKQLINNQKSGKQLIITDGERQCALLGLLMKEKVMHHSARDRLFLIHKPAN